MSTKPIHTIGKRKTSIARLWIRPGTGTIRVNKREFDNYFLRAASRMLIMQAFDVTNTVGKYDVDVNVLGGGLSGQAGAIRHAISNALCAMDPANRPALKVKGFLTRDSRKKERKLYGQPGARKRFQFSKR
jgi:small subunit ribosomal protein S9